MESKNSEVNRYNALVKTPYSELVIDEDAMDFIASKQYFWHDKVRYEALGEYYPFLDKCVILGHIHMVEPAILDAMKGSKYLKETVFDRVSHCVKLARDQTMREIFLILVHYTDPESVKESLYSVPAATLIEDAFVFHDKYTDYVVKSIPLGVWIAALTSKKGKSAASAIAHNLNYIEEHVSEAGFKTLIDKLYVELLSSSAIVDINAAFKNEQFRQHLVAQGSGRLKPGNATDLVVRNLIQREQGIAPVVKTVGKRKGPALKYNAGARKQVDVPSSDPVHKAAIDLLINGDILTDKEYRQAVDAIGKRRIQVFVSGPEGVKSVFINSTNKGIQGDNKETVFWRTDSQGEATETTLVEYLGQFVPTALDQVRVVEWVSKTGIPRASRKRASGKKAPLKQSASSSSEDID
jgi:hypothetical protein